MLYDGEPVGAAAIRLVAPRIAEVARAETGETDEYGKWSRWFDAAAGEDTIIYFSVEHKGEIVGEVFLHDIDRARREALVGYRIFEAQRRGTGTGTAALSLLVQWAADCGEVDSLVVIARSDNLASCRLAEHVGFAYTGRAREDAGRAVYRRQLAGAARRQRADGAVAPMARTGRAPEDASSR